MLSKKQLNAKIRVVTRGAGTLRDGVQTVLVNACGHAYRYNDTSYFNTLYKGITGVNVAKLEKYAIANLGVQFDRDTETFKLHKKSVHTFRELHGASGEKMGKTSLPTDAEATSFVKFLEDTLPVWYAQQEQSGPAAAAKSLNPVKVISDAAKRCVKAHEKGTIAELGNGWTLEELKVAKAAINRAVSLLDGHVSPDFEDTAAPQPMRDVTPNTAAPATMQLEQAAAA